MLLHEYCYHCIDTEQSVTTNIHDLQHWQKQDSYLMTTEIVLGIAANSCAYHISYFMYKQCLPQKFRTYSIWRDMIPTYRYIAYIS